MSTVYFIDIDGTIAPHGSTEELLPGAKERLDKINAEGGQIFFFSCRLFTPWDVRFLKEHFPYAAGYLRKPLADKYVFIDDRLDVSQCSTHI